MNRRTIAIARGVGAIGAVAALVAGVTFAAQTSSVTLSANQVGVGSANLAISSVGGSQASSITGFQDLSLLPGVPSTPFQFILYNNGPTNLDLSLSDNLNQNALPAGINPADINGELDSVTGGTPPKLASFTLADLVDSTNSGGVTYTPSTPVPLAAGASQEFQVIWTAEPGAETGSGGVATPPFDITITGTVPNS